MELRVLRYFLAVVQEESISHAAEKLHLTQPTLSRQIKDLEDEFGKQLFIRGNRQITLTEEGYHLKKRAEELVELADKTMNEMLKSQEDMSGEITIGSGETTCIEPVLKCIKDLQNEYPLIQFHIMSSNKDDLEEKLNQGLVDFSIIIDNVDKTKYHFFTLPSYDQFCILARYDDPLASKDILTYDDLADLPLIVSKQALKDKYLPQQIKSSQIVATYNLSFNAALMVKEKIGYALVLNHLNYHPELTTLSLERSEQLKWHFIWKKNQILTPIQKLFIERLPQYLND